MRAPLDIADLVDLEIRVADDAAVDDAELLARDRPIAEALAVEPGDRVGLLRGWLDGLRAAGPTPGLRIARALRLTRLALVIAGLLVGWGTAAWLLRYDGRTPVNVVHALAVLVGVQLALLVLLALGAALRGLSGGRVDALPIVGDLRAVVLGGVRLVDRLLARADAAWRDRDGERRLRWRAAWHRLRMRRSLYRDIEQWQALAAMQAFGVAFNLAALGAILTAVSLSDVAFAWATTLDLEPAGLSAAVEALALPWSGLWPAAVPDPALVEATRYSRLEGAYAGATGGRAPDPSAVGDWWRFLVMAVAVYGLAPRLLLYALARRRAARALASAPLDTPDVERVVRRLTAHRVVTRAPIPEEVVPPPARTLAPQYDPPPPKTRWALVAWRDFPVDPARLGALVGDRYDGELGGIHEVADFGAEQAALDALAGGEARVLVLAETFEAPDKAIRRFLRSLRAAVGAKRPVVVGLVAEAGPRGWRAVDGETLTLWQQHLAANEDPYLGVEALEARS